MFVIVSVPYTNNIMNLLTITEDGILSGSWFIPWKKVKSFQFVSIDINHRFYGHVREVNNKYEVKIKAAFFSTSFVVISREMKEKLRDVLSEHMVDEKPDPKKKSLSE